MLHIKFKYRDDLSKGEWRNQECYVESVEECKRIYGLGVDCDYEIVSVEGEQSERTPYVRRPSPYERTRAAVYATGNKWAIENFNATH